MLIAKCVVCLRASNKKIPSYCSVRGWIFISFNPNRKNRHFYLLPSDENRRRKWFALCGGRANRKPGYICARHFETNVYERNLKYELLLSVPLKQIRTRPHGLTISAADTRQKRDRPEEASAGLPKPKRSLLSVSATDSGYPYGRGLRCKTKAVSTFHLPIPNMEGKYYLQVQTNCIGYFQSLHGSYSAGP